MTSSTALYLYVNGRRQDSPSQQGKEGPEARPGECYLNSQDVVVAQGVRHRLWFVDEQNWNNAKCSVVLQLLVPDNSP